MTSTGYSLCAHVAWTFNYVKLAPWTLLRQTRSWPNRLSNCMKRYMIDYYRNETREVPGASETFRWLHDHGVKVATDTGFHKHINETIMDQLGWIRDGLVDVAMDVQDIAGERGRPAPYMIFRAMERLGVTSVRDVVKLGDQPSDLLEGANAGCRGVVGVLSGPLDALTLGSRAHTHLIASVADLPQLIQNEGWL